MNALVILAHPNPQSFNSAVAQTIKDELEKKGDQIKFKDLYAMNWNPVLSQADFEGFHNGKIPDDLMAEQADVKWADVVIMIAPVWWTSVPAILKGYIDRVFSLGFAYEYTATGPRGKMGGKKGLLITTSGSDEATSNTNGMMDTFKRSLADGFFGFCGFSEYQHQNLFAVTIVKDPDRQQMLESIRELVRSYT